MNRGLIFGAIAFAAAFAAERLFTSMTPDIARYNRMRAMSGRSRFSKSWYRSFRARSAARA